MAGKPEGCSAPRVGPPDALSTVMSIVEGLLARLGYVKLGKYGLSLTREGRIVSSNSSIIEDGFGGQIVGWRQDDLAAAPVERLPMAPAIAAPVAPVAAVFPVSTVQVAARAAEQAATPVAPPAPAAPVAP